MKEHQTSMFTCKKLIYMEKGEIYLNIISMNELGSLFK